MPPARNLFPRDRGRRRYAPDNHHTSANNDDYHLGAYNDHGAHHYDNLPADDHCGPDDDAGSNDDAGADNDTSADHDDDYDDASAVRRYHAADERVLSRNSVLVWANLHQWRLLHPLCGRI